MSRMRQKAIVPNEKFFRRHGIRLRKELGQHFLLDRTVAEEIVRAAELQAGDTVVEIGAGVGNLTTELAGWVAAVHAIEYDAGLLSILKQQTAEYENVHVVHCDALKYHPGVIEGIPKVKVVGNLPYSIATPLVLRFLEWREQLLLMVVTLQDEVADRLAASPGTKAYGTLTIAVQLHMHVERIASVPRETFFPVPRVESAIVKLVPLSRPAVEVDDLPLYFSLVKAAFAHRRKTFWNNLKAARFLDVEPARWQEAFRAGGIDPSCRGETLSLGAYATLANSIAEQRAKQQNS